MAARAVGQAQPRRLWSAPRRSVRLLPTLIPPAPAEHIERFHLGRDKRQGGLGASAPGAPTGATTRATPAASHAGQHLLEHVQQLLRVRVRLPHVRIGVVVRLQRAARPLLAGPLSRTRTAAAPLGASTAAAATAAAAFPHARAGATGGAPRALGGGGGCLLVPQAALAATRPASLAAACGCVRRVAGDIAVSKACPNLLHSSLFASLSLIASLLPHTVA